MEFTTRVLTDADKTAALWVEVGAMPHNCYLNDVWELFACPETGALLGAFAGDALVGIGKITRLFGDYGWLETLRVHPSWQRKGVGTAIWKRFFIEMAQMGLRAMGMYTEACNTTSKALAERFGLSVRGWFSEYLLPVACAPAGVGQESAALQPVAAGAGEALLAPHYAEMDGFLVINRTFFPAVNGLGAHLAANGMLYADAAGNLLVAGNRFHPQKLLHVPFYCGDAQVALCHAAVLAKAQNAPALSCLAKDGAAHAVRIGEAGFGKADSFMTLWTEQ